MKLSAYILWLICICFISCQGKNESSGATNITIKKDSSDIGLNKANFSSDSSWAGTYKGELPCADCSGIVTTLVLNNDETYTLTSIYEGKTKIESTGKNGTFTWIDSSTIELQEMKTGARFYGLENDQVRQLDLKGQKIAGALADKYLLKKE